MNQLFVFLAVVAVLLKRRFEEVTELTGWSARPAVLSNMGFSLR